MGCIMLVYEVEAFNMGSLVGRSCCCDECWRNVKTGYIEISSVETPTRITSTQQVEEIDKNGDIPY